ncbi:Outer membrane protein assembly factor BamA (BamA) (PDB:5EKQ) [Commensalibacter papalotli (ex Botero et al. 2024)]|uniref:Outer membrane protein assembly factor BamA (BamA) (PDB:5EKQ) n=1 Tax=Commensalibacter papalotli (ex Botero et al. 2024) TaxID=2972766 RepID=A0ABN8W9F4_9PROT|nr:Outer membrane protein assembly factor BamA (BamA) (PDB:5EKQ) [Commensalibacter papalotli (ex Botero et al. 2024)]
MRMIVNKKYYLLTILLFSTLSVPVCAKAKPKTSTTTSNTALDINNNPSSDTQDGAISLPKIDQISFSGNTIILSQILQKAIPLKKNDIANQYVIMDSMVKIAQLYKEKNIRVTITPVLEKTSINSRNIQFEIHELPMNEK